MALIRFFFFPFIFLRRLLRRRRSIVSKLPRYLKDRLARRRARSETLFLSHNDDPHGEWERGSWSQQATEYLVDCFSNPYVAVFTCICIIYYFSGLTLLTDLRYKIGLFDPAILTISTLETSVEDNFPEDKASLYIDQYGRDRIRGTYKDDEIIWKVEGFSKYIHRYTDAEDPAKFGKFRKIILKNDIKIKKIVGLWIFGVGKLRDPDPGNLPVIRAFRIMDHVTDNFWVSAKTLEAAILMRMAVIGDVQLYIKFDDSISKKVHKERISLEHLNGKGLCNYFLKLPFEKRINSAHIRMESSSLEQTGVVLLDKVTIVVAASGTTQSMAHTLENQNWCIPSDI